MQHNSCYLKIKSNVFINEPANEAPKNISKAEEVLQLILRSRCWPSGHCQNLPRNHPDCRTGMKAEVTFPAFVNRSENLTNVIEVGV